MKKLYVSWNDVTRQVAEICRQIQLDNWQPEYVVGLTRGGLTPANLISQYLDKPMYSLNLSLKKDYKKCSDASLAKDAYLGKKILIVDDINDTGATFDWLTKNWMYLEHQTDTRWHSIWNNSVRFACLYNNAVSTFTEINYAAEEINKSETPCWIVFPWEEWWKRWNPQEDL